jgi:hypothetical protein
VNGRDSSPAGGEESILPIRVASQLERPFQSQDPGYQTSTRYTSQRSGLADDSHRSGRRCARTWHAAYLTPDTVRYIRPTQAGGYMIGSSIGKHPERTGQGDQTVSRTTSVLAVLAVVSVLGACGRDPGPAAAPEFGPPVNEPGGASAGPAPPSSGPTIQTINITVRGGQVSGETGRVTVPLGTPVTIS